MLPDSGPYSNHRLTARLELKNKPGTFNRVTHFFSKEKANLGAIDIVEATRDKIVRDITFDVLNEAHGKRVLQKLAKLRDVKLVQASDRIFLLHLGGKISVQSKTPIKTRTQLSMAYTPGVARVSTAIGEDKSKVYNLTIKANAIAVVSDGTAILGLGDLGPEAALPVMEGKAMLFKEFAGIDAWPICLATHDVNEIVNTVKYIAPVFGGINLEDISYPRCFEIENRLKRELDIPVMHDDQHGTAVVVLAALKNALKIVKKDISKIQVVMSGIGAAGVACSRILLLAGVKHLVACGRRGIVFSTEESGLAAAKKDFMAHIHRDRPGKNLKEALIGADVFIG
ncbi:MAG: NAD-dependent malic enzyme, partial [Candidatus Omnitrophica bacterium]|nr:NAD-dependent malic enzyme [Candidatus Omnitrophota bacterium]